MVRLFFVLFMLFTSLSANDTLVPNIKSHEDLLSAKIRSFLSDKKYEENRNFIEVVFEPKSSFYEGERVNALKVVQTLKENGLLNLYFKKPQEFRLNFKTSGSPLFFVKIMSDTLRNIGYYRYVTTASNLDASEFIWSINLTSEYITDPLALEAQLAKSSCKIIDIERNTNKEWTYVIDMTHAKLHVPVLQNGEEIKLKRSLYAHWLNVSKITKITITSPNRNSWYPYIAYYDSSLHLIEIIKKEKISRKLALTMPKHATYIKISDLYTLKNVRDSLKLFPSGVR